MNGAERKRAAVRSAAVVVAALALVLAAASAPAMQTPSGREGRRADSTATDSLRRSPADTLASDGREDPWLWQIVTGIPVDSLYTTLFGSLHSLAYDTFRVDTSGVWYHLPVGGAHQLYRWLYHGAEAATELGISTLSNPERIIQASDYFRFGDRSLGWYPVIAGASDFRLKVGAKVFARKGPLGVAVKGKYTGAEKWSSYALFTVRGTRGVQVMQFSTKLLAEEDDDLYFYGIGRDPRTDPRSHFLSGADEERARYYQDKAAVQMILGLRTSRHLESRYTVQYMMRDIGVAAGERSGLAQVFNANNLPGAWDSPAVQLYNEAALRYDSSLREREGSTMELYAGFAQGLDRDPSRYLRYGFDGSVHIPVLTRRVLLAPRLVMNAVANLRDDTPLRFYDYPRHPTFRGVSPRKMLFADELVFVPALDLHLLAHPRITVGPFVDMVTVASSPGDIRPADNAWAVGLNLVYHDRYSDLASLVFAAGPRGVRLSMYIGAEPDRNERTRWY